MEDKSSEEVLAQLKEAQTAIKSSDKKNSMVKPSTPVSTRRMPQSSEPTSS